MAPAPPSIFHGRFTVNLGVHIPCVAVLELNEARGRAISDAHCEIRQRLSDASKLGKDKWWPLDETVAQSGETVATALIEYGLPFLDRYDSFSAIVARHEIDGTLPFQNAGRSTLAVAIIHAACGDKVKAKKSFDDARRLASDHAGFRQHVTDIQSRIGL
ncbi:MAG TPA: DUF4304 domain-containing protein [Steroidobacteraceae bacterium]|nr:DUF4304 domain-containing protein [Steroidobacteraceae bacterium]